VADTLAADVLRGDAAAVARALSEVEDFRPSSLPAQRALLRELEGATPAARNVVGLTGPPGAGKSTLAGALIRHWVDAGQSVGMVAVDPSSRRSGGALLGDRARLRFSADEAVFVRSMAAREQLGGLAPAARAATVVLRAGFDWTLVETVGVGQSEVDIASVADSVVLVLQPGAGDTLQFMKAGILEIPDVFVVNKWDLGEAAERTRADLEAMLAVTPPASPGAKKGWTPRVLGASAEAGDGIGDLAETLAAHADWLRASGELERRRQAGRAAWALELFEQRYGNLGLERLGGRKAALNAVRELPGTALDAFSDLATRAGLDG